MEHVEAISEGVWSSFNGMCSDEANFMAQLLNNSSLPNEALISSSHYAASQESNPNVVGFYESSLYSSDETNNLFLQGCGYGDMIFPDSFYPNTPHPFFVANNNVMQGDDYLNQDVSNDSMESNENLHEDFRRGKSLQLERELEMPMPERMEEEKVSSPSGMSNKRPRIHGDIPRSKGSMKIKKGEDDDENEKYNDCKQSKAVLVNRQSSSSSEDNSNASHELNGGTSGSKGTLNSNGKTRANRGSATDPQSLYARKRRERINERLRVLQGLVPNGTKVDISTMLEEAVQYVKFLQLQIKLLSSDEHWMYSPIAYNGMDLGLDIRIPTPNPEC